MKSNVTTKSSLAFGVGLTGQNMIITFVTMFLFIFLTDNVGVSPVSVGILFGVARLWDGLNDPIMGTIVDRTRHKLGKCRPYIIFLSLPLGIITAMLFWVPDVSSQTQLVYIWIAYLLWGMIYTATDIPVWTLASRMSSSSQDRNKLISFGRVGATIGSMLAAVLTLELKNLFGSGNDELGFFLTAVFFGVLGSVLMLLMGLNVRENDYVDERKVTLMDSFRAIFGNGQLLIMILHMLLFVFATLNGGATIYFATYVLGSEGLMIPIVLVYFLATALGSAVVPMITKRFDSKKVLIVATAINIPLGIGVFLYGYSSLALILFFAGASGFLLGIPGVIRTAMFANTVEWDQKKSGVRNEGVVFATATLMSKVQSSFGGLILGLVLGFIGYVPNIEQTQFAKDGLYALMTLSVSLGAFLSLIPMYWYKLDDATHKKLIEEIEV